MKIAQMIDGLRVVGGAERLQRTFAEAVRDSGVELTVLTLNPGEPAAVAELESLGARVVRFPARRFVSPRRAAKLVRFLRRERFDVLHLHLVRSTVLGALAGRAAGVPTVVTLHNSADHRRLSPLLEGAETLALRHLADRVVAVGWETASSHRPRIPHREIDVIPNGVPSGAQLGAGERAAIRAELEVPEGSLLVIAVGRLHPQKGFFDLLDALEALADVEPNLQLRIAGRGRLEAELRQAVDARRLGDRVRLLGVRSDVPRLLAASDVYVSSAHWEGLPVATLEAMAAGLPVVATRVGDVERVVIPETGTLVEPGQPRALADALRRMAEDPGRRRAQGVAGRARVESHFGSERWAERLLALYGEIRRSVSEDEDRPREEHRCAS